MMDENGNFPFAIPILIADFLIKALIYTVVTIVVTLAVTKVTEDVIDYVKEQERKNNEKNHYVYQLRNKESKEIEYVGRTVNIEAREKAHKERFPNHSLEVMYSGLTREEARGLEQIYMIEYNTKSFLNKINGISPKNKKIEVYMEAGRQAIHYFGNVVSNEALYWMGK